MIFVFPILGGNTGWQLRAKSQELRAFPRGLFVLLVALVAGAAAQQPQPVQMASLHSGQELHWQRTSPSAQHSDGPVLYQLVFSPGTPGAIAKFDTNTRHLVSSDITENGGIVAVGSSGFTINVSTGIVNFVNAQTFPGVGTVISVATGPGLIGGPITTNGTLHLDTTFTNNLYPQLATANTFTAGTQAVQTGGATTVGLAVQGASAQTANLEEWRNNGGAAMASVSAGGQFSGDGSGLTNLSDTQLVDGNDTLLQRKAALLQWYRQDFAVGAAPAALGFDGANIWVTNSNANTVSKLRASDGAVLGTFAVNCGPSPFAIAFDHTSIWVANQNSNYVTKVRPSDGAVLGTYPAGSNPRGVVFDGANLWVTNNTAAGTVTELRPSDGAILRTVSVGSFPSGVAFDGANIWVIDENGFLNVIKVRVSDGTVVGSYNAGTFPEGVAFDGANIWVASSFTPGKVTKLRASDGTNLGTFQLSGFVTGLAFDGTNLWVTNGNNLTKVRTSDGAVLGSTPATAAATKGVVFDGANIWVANAALNSVSKL